MKIVTATLLLSIITLLASGQHLSNSEKDSLKAEIRRLLENDQKYRSILSIGTLRIETVDSIKNLSCEAKLNFYATNKLTLDKRVSDSLWNLQSQIDFENISKLEEIIKKFGWPSNSRLDDKISAEVLLFHTPTNKVAAMESLLITEVKEQRMDPKQFAMFIDNIRLKHKQKQLYGTNTEFSRELMKEMPPAIDDIAITNNARRKIGLEPLKEGEYRIKN